jgi:hypothetical protein
VRWGRCLWPPAHAAGRPRLCCPRDSSLRELPGRSRLHGVLPALLCCPRPPTAVRLRAAAKERSWGGMNAVGACEHECGARGGGEPALLLPRFAGGLSSTPARALWRLPAATTSSNIV